MVSGINHITLSVKDLELSFRFYSQVLGFRPLAKWQEGAYLLGGDLWFCLSLDSKTRQGPLPEYTHIALNVSPENFDQLSAELLKSGAMVWKENTSPGASLYFLDPDGHKLEIHTLDWQSRIKTAKEENWEGMEFFV